MTLSKRVSELMKQRGLSQAELARRVGVSQPSIYKLVRANKTGSVHLHKIARELQTTSAYLTGETTDPSVDAVELALTGADREWLDLLHALAPKDRAAALQLVRSLAHSAQVPKLQSQRQDFGQE